jgi:MYXO-CTERM domain-containing protein
MKRTRHVKQAMKRQLWQAAFMAPLVFVLVAGAGCPSVFESEAQRAVHIRQAVVGRDGAKTITAAATVVNAYAALAGAADPVATDTTITVANIAALNSGNALFTTNLAQGDLLLIVQMQGATLSDVSDTAIYGAFTLGSAGHYEFVGVEGVGTGATANVITLACGLKNGYSRAGKTQVIRIPQYTTLTINTGASIVATPWNGTVGGVVAVHAETTVQLDGKIDVSAQGFRGGAAPVAKTTTAAGTGVVIYRSANATLTSAQGGLLGGLKGEGIAGYPGDGGTTAGYGDVATNPFGRGAPANAGGGGDSHNAGGGGGANAPSGSGTAWSGQGVMRDVAGGVVGAAAWLLEVATRTNSEGGGRGGYSYSDPADATQSGLNVGPNPAANPVWGGDNRRQVGGLGGRPLANNPASQLFMGGGGGAGDGNNSVAGPGGNGGGLIFLIAGAIAGNGIIQANGQVGGDASGLPNAASDAAGGGGGGGTVIVHAASITGTPTISAKGGVGGNQTNSNGAEAEGPGGGGGGGYIAVSGGGTPTLSAAGALGGTTTRLIGFPSNGATAGNDGQTAGNASSFLYCGTDTPTTTITPTNFTDLADKLTNNPLGSFAFTNTEDFVTYQCKVDNGAYQTCAANYTTTALPDGAHTITVYSTDLRGNVETPAVSYQWTIDTAAPDTVIATEPAKISDSATGGFTFQAVLAGAADGGVVGNATYQCMIDLGAWAACNASYTTPALTDGSHTISVRATDPAGNTDPTPASYTWVIDTVSPDTVILTEPAKLSNSPSGSFTFQATESAATDGGTADGGVVLTNATFQCQLDTGAWASCNASYTTPQLADGSHTISVRATNQAGDTDPTPATYTWTIDTVTPNTIIVIKPTDPSASATGTFTFQATEAGAGIDGAADITSSATFKCNLDGTGWVACNASYTTPALADGSHAIAVTATDASGNTDLTPATATWTVAVNGPKLDAGSLDAGADAAAVVPVTIIATHPTDPSTGTTGNFTFQATEATAGTDARTDITSSATFQCNLDGTGWLTCLATYSIAGLKDGSHTITVRATDASGNADPKGATFTWRVAANTTAVDASGLDGAPTPPKTIIVTHPANPSTSSTGTFTFQATEDVPGSDASVTVTGVTFQCNLDGTGWVSCDANFTTPNLPDGTHTITVRATDPNGNTDPSGATFTWTVQTAKLDASTADVAVATPDASLAQPDAAPALQDVKILGSGFCAVAPARSTSPAAFAGLFLVALATLLRRRRR